MAVTRKIKATDLESIAGNRANAALQSPILQETQIPATAAEVKTPAQKDEKKVLFNIKLKESILKDWKQFCLANDITLTAAIKKAMNFYIKSVKNGNIEI